MLGAVMFGHKQLPAGDRGDHRAGREGRQGAVRLPAGRHGRASRRPMLEHRRGRPARRLQDHRQAGALRRRRRRQGEGQGGALPAEGDAKSDQSRSRRVFKDARGQGRPLATSSTPARASTAATSTTVRPIVAEVGVLPRTHGSALFTRGETQALVVATLGTGEDEQIIDALEGDVQASASCSTTTSRPTRSARPAAWARPAAARSATASSPGARIRPMLPTQRRVPLHDPRRLRDHRVERLVVDGVGLRRLAGADGRRRAAEGARSPASPWA